MPRKKTNAEFQKELHQVWGNRIWTNDHYKNCSTKLTFHCYKKSHPTWKAKPQYILHGSGCPRCRYEHLSKIRVERHQKDFDRKVRKMSITPLTEYKGYHKKVTFECQYGHKWTTEAGVVLSGHGCPVCAEQIRIKKNTLNSDQVKKDLDKRGITLLSKYHTCNDPVKLRCQICGYTWSCCAESILDGHGCPKCSQRSVQKINRARAKNRFMKVIKKAHIRALSPYINNLHKITLECRHGHIWATHPSHIMSGERCPYCNGYHGEQLIVKLLKKHGFRAMRKQNSVKAHINSYFHSYRIYYKHHQLRYDFMINLNHHLYAIEFDGIQHFKPTDFGGEINQAIKDHASKRKIHIIKLNLRHKLSRQHYHDELKNQWSEKYLHAPVIRIKNIKNYGLGKKLRKLVKSSLLPIINA